MLCDTILANKDVLFCGLYQNTFHCQTSLCKSGVNNVQYPNQQSSKLVFTTVLMK